MNNLPWTSPRVGLVCAFSRRHSKCSASQSLHSRMRTFPIVLVLAVGLFVLGGRHLVTGSMFGAPLSYPPRMDSARADLSRTLSASFDARANALATAQQRVAAVLARSFRSVNVSLTQPPPTMTRAQSAPPSRPPPPSPFTLGNYSAAASALAASDRGCNPRAHAGYGGGSLGWGMSFKVETAQECCDACRAHAQTCVSADAKGKVYYRRKWQGTVVDERCASVMSSNELGTHAAQPCNVFVFCPTPLAEGSLCWSNDVWNHSYGELEAPLLTDARAVRPDPRPRPCLKPGECWLKNQQHPDRPWAGAYLDYPAGYRKKHRTAPALVQWMSGSLTSNSVQIDGPHWHW